MRDGGGGEGEVEEVAVTVVTVAARHLLADPKAGARANVEPLIFERHRPLRPHRAPEQPAHQHRLARRLDVRRLLLLHLTRGLLLIELEQLFGCHPPPAPQLADLVVGDEGGVIGIGRRFSVYPLPYRWMT